MAQQPEHDHEQEHEREDEAGLEEEDIVEVVEDDGDEGMDEDDDNNEGFDGEIIIGGPGPEDEEMDEAPREDNSWGVTALHAPSQSLFTISLHPTFPSPPLAISGGEDDLAFIFSPIPSDASTSTLPGAINADTFSPVKLTGHSDSVVAAGWNFDGSMVATGGMDGKVRVWRRVKGGSRRSSSEQLRNGTQEMTPLDEWKTWEFLTSLETSSEVTWLAWHPKGNVLAAGCEDAQVWLWNLPSGETMTVLSSHTFSSSAGLWVPGGKQLLTTSLDSTLCLWDPRTPTPLFKTSVFAPPNSPELDPSESGITALAVAPGGNLAAVGSSNGSVKLVQLPAGNIVATLPGHAEGESIEALVFVDLLNGLGGGKGVVLVSGATDGKGFVWDIATGRVRSELKHDEPITSLAPHAAPHLHLVTSGSADGTLKTWDIRTGAVIGEHKGHAGVVNGVAVASAPDGLKDGAVGNVVVSAGDEGVSLIWRL